MIMESRVITGIGSLPHRTPEEAMEFSWKNDVPFLPELTVEKGEYLTNPVRAPGRLACLGLFKSRKYDKVKIQAPGPATMSKLNGVRTDTLVDKIREHIGIVLDGLKAEEVYLFLDEPDITVATEEYLGLWRRVYEGFRVVRGVHNCSPLVDWGDVLESDVVDIISFDASAHDITKDRGYRNNRNNKRVAWGVRRLANIKDFRDGDLLTTPCGMTYYRDARENRVFYTPEDCEARLRDLQDIRNFVLGNMQIEASDQAH